jgi:hypothetical protein
MANLRLTFACGPFDRTQSLRDGSSDQRASIWFTCHCIFWRMLQFKEFHSKLCILCARVDRDNGKKNDAQHSAL